MERQFIDELRRQLPTHPQLLLGVGDDAAILRLSQQSDCVVTSDLLADGTHFQSATDELRRIGRKALAVNLSDLAAMAARPIAVVVSILLPHTNALSVARQMYEGILPLAEEFNVAIAGGDTNCWNGELVICVTAIGETTSNGPLRRDGAQPGDVLLVTGTLGGSRLGKQFDFTPRIHEALAWHERYDLHAAIDITDGLALDLSRMCDASECGAVLDLPSIPIADDAVRWAQACGQSRTPLEHALADGEDFELLLAASPDAAQKMLAELAGSDIRLSQIGHVVEGSGIQSRQGDGALVDLSVVGYEHGA